MRHELVIFDCDGVLVDSEPTSNRIMAENLTRHGLPLTAEQSMELFVGCSMAGVKERAISLGAELPEDWVEQVYSEEYACLRKGVPLVSGIPELLKRLDAAGISCCVASNGSQDKMRITLGQNGLWERFHPNAMFSAHELGVSKPDPGLFQTAASQFQVQARDCVVIEDSTSGVTAAIRAGMRCLGFAAHDDGARLRELGAEVFHEMAEVPALLGL